MIFFDKKLSYIDDYSKPAITANGTGLSLSLVAASDIIPTQQFQISLFPCVRFFCGLISAFLVHSLISIQNADTRRREQRDSMTKFLSEVYALPEIPTEISDQIPNVKAQIIKVQDSLLSIRVTEIITKLSAWFYFISLITFIASIAICINTISSLK